MICTSSGGRNVVVSMKNVSNRKATSTKGVLSIATPNLRFLILGIGRPFHLFRTGCQRLNYLVAGLINHIGEIIDLIDEEIIGDNRSEERRVGKECRSRW